MRIEIFFLIVVAAICYHIYTDGKWITPFLKYTKYYKIGGVILIGLILYWLFKKDPSSAHKLLLSGNEYVKYLPIDPTTSNIITPILDFTSKWNTSSPFKGNNGRENAGITKMMNSGIIEGGTNNATKRSVSESKKKFVASNQDWTCAICKEKLKASFEVDHIVPLYKGGNNHIDNLRALCLECHRSHTISDKL